MAERRLEPSMMVSLLLYGYCMGERSSRRIEQLCERDIGFRVIEANQRPDHSPIARFLKEPEKELEKLFTEELKLCAEAGLTKAGIVALGGDKDEGTCGVIIQRGGCITAEKDR